MTVQGQGPATPNIKSDSVQIRAAKLRRGLIEAWADFAGNSSPENAQKLHNIRLAAELLLAEVKA